MQIQRKFGGIGMRYIVLKDGTGMSGEAIIFATDAPKEILEKLEYESCRAYIENEEVPIWHDVLKEKGYTFDYVDSYENVTAYGTSDDWLKEKFSEVTEKYVIDD